ncbi:DMT family transporter [Proteus hauseri]|uniref:DMT family transporter n=1 Tax=Proteus hauseri TaxID=183417 RepID=UPI0010097839|nr:DMT family transporter [Proteus hauseri]QAV22843.1 EamA family transporter [Proteus hauseri]
MQLRQYWAKFGPTTLFVLLWSSGAIFSRWGLDNGSSFAILTWRFVIALAFLAVLCFQRHRFLPPKGRRLKTAWVGLLIIGGYSICYLLALANSITPGMLATIMGIQPIITLWIIERNFTATRLFGLLIALAGLVLVVAQSLFNTALSLTGMIYALVALLCMSFGAISQKKLQLAPMDALPLQYVVSLALCLLFVPFQPIKVSFDIGFIIPVLWLAIIISVVAQLLLYRLLTTGNLVNVTSLFYLVPGVTALMDYIFLGNKMSWLSLAGMGAIIIGLLFVFKKPKAIIVEEKME